MLVATPSGLTLAPEGGAHQSIATPMIGMAQDKLASFDPAFTDELAVIMRWGFDYMQADDGGSIYLRLSTRALEQPDRDVTEIADDIVRGAYWRVAPDPGAPLAIVYSGTVAPEAVAAHAEIVEDIPSAGLLAVTSPDMLHKDWGRRSIWASPYQGFTRSACAERGTRHGVRRGAGNTFVARICKRPAGAPVRREQVRAIGGYSRSLPNLWPRHGSDCRRVRASLP